MVFYSELILGLIGVVVEQGLTFHQSHYMVIVGHIGDKFFKSYDAANSVKALKEDTVGPKD